MNIICISKGTSSRGGELASELARKLGYQELSRKEVVEAAIEEGIAVGRLETAMIKTKLINEALILEKEYYQAFATAMICRRALEGNILYHGRTGHLLLPGVTHVMKVRVVVSDESVIDEAMARMNLPWEKAKRYVEDVHEDISRWVKTYYGADLDHIGNFNVIINLDEMNPANAATALCSMAELPEFRGTPATRKALEDLLLASRVRIRLARNEKTCGVRFHVKADGGQVNVSYQPQYEREAALVPEALESMDGITELNCTMASSHILWIQERFKDCQDACDQVGDLALKYNAAVEVVRYTPSQEAEEIVDPAREGKMARPSPNSRENGGIQDDLEETPVSEDDSRMHEVHDQLVLKGVSGGTKAVTGPTSHLLDSLDTRMSYFLVVVGDVFVNKGHAASVRMTRELSRSISENLHAPVVGLDQLKETFMFGPRQVVQMVFALMVAVVLFGVTFYFQTPILEFLHDASLTHKIVSAVAVAAFVPVFAYTYGTFTRNVLKLIRME